MSSKQRSVFVMDLFVIFLLLGSIPRYVRINRIKATLKDVINDFENNGYQLVDQQDIASLAAQVNILLLWEQTFRKKDKGAVLKVLESDGHLGSGYRTVNELYLFKGGFPNLDNYTSPLMLPFIWLLRPSE